MWSSPCGMRTTGDVDMMAAMPAPGPQPFAMDSGDGEPTETVSAADCDAYSSQWQSSPAAAERAAVTVPHITAAAVEEQSRGDSAQRENAPDDGMWL